MLFCFVFFFVLFVFCAVFLSLALHCSSCGRPVTGRSFSAHHLAVALAINGVFEVVVVGIRHVLDFKQEWRWWRYSREEKASLSLVSLNCVPAWLIHYISDAG